MRLAVVEVQVQRAVRRQQLAHALQARREEPGVVGERVRVGQIAAALHAAGVERRVEVGHVERAVGQRRHRGEVVAGDQQVVVESGGRAGPQDAHRHRSLRSAAVGDGERRPTPAESSWPDGGSPGLSICEPVDGWRPSFAACSCCSSSSSSRPSPSSCCSAARPPTRRSCRARAPTTTRSRTRPAVRTRSPPPPRAATRTSSTPSRRAGHGRAPSASRATGRSSRPRRRRAASSPTRWRRSSCSRAPGGPTRPPTRSSRAPSGSPRSSPRPGATCCGLQVDPAGARRIGRSLRRAASADAALPRACASAGARRRALRPRQGAAATARYLVFARERLGRADLAIASYHMGIGNLQSALADYGEADISYAQLFFDSTPPRHEAAWRRLAALGDDSATYLWRVMAAREIMRLFAPIRRSSTRLAAADREGVRRGGPASRATRRALHDARRPARRLVAAARGAAARGLRGAASRGPRMGELAARRALAPPTAGCAIRRSRCSPTSAPASSAISRRGR